MTIASTKSPLSTPCRFSDSDFCIVLSIFSWDCTFLFFDGDSSVLDFGCVLRCVQSGKSAELINYLSEWHARTVRLPDNLNALPKADAADDIEMIMASQAPAPMEAGQPAGTATAPAGAASPVAPRRNQRREHRDNTAAPAAGNGEEVVDDAQAAQAELHQRVAKRARLAAKVAMEAETRDKVLVSCLYHFFFIFRL
jgi:hypothetical protein